MNRCTTGQSGELSWQPRHARRELYQQTFRTRSAFLGSSYQNAPVDRRDRRKTCRFAHYKIFESSCSTPHSHNFKSDVNGPSRPVSDDGGAVKAIPRASSNSYIIRIGPASCRIVSLRLSVCWCQGGLTEGTNMQLGSLDNSHPISFLVDFQFFLK